MRNLQSERIACEFLTLNCQLSGPLFAGLQAVGQVPASPRTRGHPRAQAHRRWGREAAARLKANAVRKFVTDRTAVSCATRPAAGSIAGRRAGSVSPKNGVALAALSLARPSCLFATSLRSTSPASGNASVRVTSRQTAAQASASRRFSRSGGGLTPNGARPATLPATAPSRRAS